MYITGTAAQKLHHDHSDKKRTPEFPREIKVMNDCDPSKSIRSITRDMAVFRLLAWYFACLMRKD